MAKDKHILFGFGGSGLSSLVQFAKWVSQDYKVSLRARDDFAFVLFDTAESDLQAAEDQIREHFKGVIADPIIKSLSLSSPFGDELFHEIAQEKLRLGGTPTNQRIKDAWWYETAVTAGAMPKPFLAPNLQGSVRLGAGQCPPVSAFCAWTLAYQNEIEPLVQSVVEEFEHRDQGGIPQSLSVSTYLVAGLCGGTGRGSWAPIGLEIATSIRRMGKQCKPQGFFIDATAFEKKLGNDQFIKQRVNSLTGISEIYGWLRNAHNARSGGTIQHLELPAFSHPNDGEVDAISSKHSMKIIDGGTESGSASPVDQAFLFGGRSRSGRVAHDPNSIFEMIGTSIFARVCQPKISEEEINKGSKRLGSIGVAQYFVPATDIKSYLTKRIKLRMPRDVLRTEGSKALCKDRISKILETLAPAFRASDDNAIIKTMRDTLSGSMKSDIDRFGQSIDSQNRKDVIASAEKLKGLITKEKLSAAVNAAIAMAFQSQRSTPEEAIRRLILANVNDLMLQDVQEMIDTILTTIFGYQALLRILETPGHIDLIKKIQEYGASASMPFGFGDPFSPIEKISLLRTAEMHIATLAAKGLRAEFESRMQTIIDTVSRWKRTLGQFISHIQTDATELESADIKLAGKLFIHDEELTGPERDDWIIRNANELLKENLGERLISRRLRPILTETKLKNMQNATRLNGGSMTTLISDIFKLSMESSLGSIVENNNLTPGEFRPETQRELAALISKLRATVQLDQFKLEQEFSFVDVIQDLIKFWEACLHHDTIKGDRRLQDELGRAFRRQFGGELSRRRDTNGIEGDTFEFPGLATVLENMCIDLAATCDPMIEFETKEPSQVVTIFLPRDSKYEGDGQILKELEKTLGNSDKAKIQGVIIKANVERSDSSPFLMLAYCPSWIQIQSETVTPSDTAPDSGISGTLDQVRTFSYRKLPDVKRWLIAAEEKDGRTLFQYDRYGQGTYGFGYVFPAFVRNDKWSALRWKPWAADLENQRLQAEKIHAEAAAWALCSFDSEYLNLLITTEFGDPIKKRFASLQDESPRGDYELGRSLEELLRQSPELKKGPILVGPLASDDGRWKITRNLFHKTTNGFIETGADKKQKLEEIPRKFSSLSEFLKSIKDPKNANIAKYILEERDLIISLIDQKCHDPIKVQCFLADCVVKLLDQERTRVKTLRQHPELLKAVDEVYDAAVAWRDRCSPPTEA